MERDRVHRRHGEPGAVDDAAHGPVERDVVEVVLGGVDLLGILLVEVPQLADVGLPEEALSSKESLASRARSPPFSVTASGLTSSWSASVSTKQR